LLEYYKGRGCVQCDFTGYSGRQLVAELWTPSDQDVMLINRGAPRDQLIESAAKNTFSMADSAYRLLESGSTNLEELMRMLRTRPSTPCASWHHTRLERLSVVSCRFSVNTSPNSNW